MATTTQKRAIRSFANVRNSTVHPIRFNGDGAKYIGLTEPTWPTVEEQNAWSYDEYQMKLGQAYAWYSYQDGKHGRELALKALGMSGHFPELISALKDSNSPLEHTPSWLIRMAHVGLRLRFHERRFLIKQIRKSLDNMPAQTGEIVEKINKPNIQDFIAAKLKIAMGTIDAHFDEFIQNDYVSTNKRTILNILADPETTVPANRTKDLIAYANKFLEEYRLIGKNDQITEAYSQLSRRQIKACISWWESAISDISSFGQMKKSTRKTRKKKATTPAKIVSKLRYLPIHPETGLTSIDPTVILKSTELWVVNVKQRKIGHYVALGNSTLDIKGSKILNIDPAKSIQKTLRKMPEQLKQFNSLGKAAAVRWLENIKSVKTNLRERLNGDTILLKAIK
jgi:hypothetical protein